MPARKD